MSADDQIKQLQKELRVLKHEFERLKENRVLLEQRWLFQTLHEEIEATNRELDIAREAAEEANQSKSIFLANMSHEIRTPMNAILGFTEILSGLIDDEQHLEYLSAIQTSGKSLLGLINDILDLTKVETGKLELEYEAVDVQSVFLEMKHVFSQRIRDKGIDFIIDIDESLPSVLILDEVRMRQVLLNLVGNAVKFTDGGYIKLSVYNRYPEEDRSKLDLVFSIADTGIGIPEDQMEKIFDAFEQQKGQSFAQYGGTGLGLAITKKLIEMMKGEISVESEVGKGSTFNVVLKHVDVASVSKSELERELGIDVESVVFDHASILVVDDVAINRNLVNGYLEPYDFTIFEAENGEEALACIRIHKPGLVLMDMKMPVMDGYEAAKISKETPETGNIPVIALTAAVMKQSEEAIRELCDGYLRKPVSKMDLVAELMKFLDHTVAEPEPVPAVSESLEPEGVTSSEVHSDTALENLPELAQILETEIHPIWEELKNSSVITDISDFTRRNLELSNKHEYAPFTSWVNLLQKHVTMFDLDKVHETLEELPGLIHAIKKHISE